MVYSTTHLEDGNPKIPRSSPLSRGADQVGDDGLEPIPAAAAGQPVN
jgi:hypothetical protein